MLKFEQIDDQMLNAFVDGELDPAHCENVLYAMEEDAGIRDRVYQLRRAKDFIKLAFADARPRRASRPAVSGSLWGWLSAWGLAASILVVVSAVLGGSAGYYYASRLAMDPADNFARLAQERSDKVVLHVSQSDPEQFGALLDYISEFVEKSERRGGEVAVIANAGGLDLLRTGVSPFEQRILQMMRDHPNVHFIACANSIRALRDKGVNPEFYQGIDTSKPAMDQIISRVREGWTYIKVESLREI